MRAAWLLPLAVVACGKHERPDRATRAKGVFHEITIPTPPGMSGMALDDRGVIWAVPERDRRFVELTLDGKVTMYPMIGFPDHVDTEGVAWLGPGKFAITTEGQDDPTATVIWADMEDGKLVAKRTRALTSAELGVELTLNKGGEGACGHGDDVIVGIEQVGRFADGRRWAPIARLRGNALTVTKLELTSEAGKISSLDCTIDAAGTAHVWAIERHFGVSRILRFELPLGATQVTPRVTLDLSEILQDSLNLEGIVQLPDGRLVAINDNQSRTVEGASELIIFEPGAGTR